MAKHLVPFLLEVVTILHLLFYIVIILCCAVIPVTVCLPDTPRLIKGRVEMSMSIGGGGWMKVGPLGAMNLSRNFLVECMGENSLQILVDGRYCLRLCLVTVALVVD